ncbi:MULTISPECIES: AraC family transcriptional regulator [Pseudomonas]|uniref:AraC family transcriptional regulator n=1 Tax=Pseudomonas TaxID=286 RepID=UPI00055F8AD8|nr:MULTISPECIES: AraC family transcriptional regulator [Pseudomonas]MDG9856670.1 AraC family transcriptional regulator [Pseudomonas nitroreducens]MDH1073884.1 AraC family transcriptional regulator [Pseudomonas nitroreducens]NMZ60914.1 AraC family transcriptional regulator [Pseudomonas nitroreducens]NMZ71463.1 AraC family transcriptional regulator [Pseudomonas nitroreducens]NNN25482.1 AraC family transcriptional regulator [Pseudomonas nitroreducens]
MNSIDHLIQLAGLRGSLDLRCRFLGDWALDHEPLPEGTAQYHVVLSGSCRAEMPDGQALDLEAGDVLVLPDGAAHLLRSQGARVAAQSPEVHEAGLLPVHRLGTGEGELDMLCGSFHYQRGSLLIGSLPSVLKVSCQDNGLGDAVAALVGLLRAEADGNQAGARFLVDALSSALFTLILRVYLQEHTPSSGTLALLADRRLSRAWQAMLDDPAHEWTIEALAERANMSRATFTRLFTQVAGRSPWALLTTVRMELAYRLLSTSQLRLCDIAAQVGYQSQASFTKKFRDTYGEAPGRLRRAVN